MRVSVACRSCRQKKIKCRHTGHPPCHGCTLRGIGEDCTLLSTQEFRKIKHAGPVVTKLNTGKIQFSKTLVATSIKCVSQHYPELVFLRFPNNTDLASILDDVVGLGPCSLSAPYLEADLGCISSELTAHFETRLMEKVDDKGIIDFLSLLQSSIL
ncbi:hypothetical protein KL927_003355 [Ogataea polymorpha]|nr:hypothetical protein KL927_003355 [Ogataea polymorpha]